MDPSDKQAPSLAEKKKISPELLERLAKARQIAAEKREAAKKAADVSTSEPPRRDPAAAPTPTPTPTSTPTPAPAAAAAPVAKAKRAPVDSDSDSDSDSDLRAKYKAKYSAKYEAKYRSERPNIPQQEVQKEYTPRDHAYGTARVQLRETLDKHVYEAAMKSLFGTV